MSEVTSCLLCLHSCSDYKCLYDDDGVYDMELYNITVKYFNTMFITETSEYQLPVVCLKCWQYMSEFNNFQSLIIMAHEKLSKDNLELHPEADGDQRAKSNESLSELEKMDEVSIKMEITTEPTCISSVQMESIKMEDSLQLLQVGGEQRANQNVSPSELEQNDEGSFKIEITTEPTCISSGEKITSNYIESSTHVKEKTTENLSCDENSQSPNFNDIASDPEGCDEITESEALQSGEESDGNSLLQELTLRNPELHSPADDSAGSQTNLIYHYNTDIIRYNTTAEELDNIIAKWKSDFECAICQTVVPNFPSLRSHTKQMHPQMKCQISCCERIHLGPSVIAQHAVFHMNPQYIKCQLCSKSFNSFNALYTHRKRVHSMSKSIISTAPQRKCRICEKTFMRKDDWEEHEANHMGIKLYTCLLCSKTFTYRTLMYRHNRKSHPTEYVNRKGTTNPSYKRVNLDDVTSRLDIAKNGLIGKAL